MITSATATTYDVTSDRDHAPTAKRNAPGMNTFGRTTANSEYRYGVHENGASRCGSRLGQNVPSNVPSTAAPAARNANSSPPAKRPDKNDSRGTPVATNTSDDRSSWSRVIGAATNAAPASSAMIENT